MKTELYLCQTHLHIASEPLQPVNAEVFLVVISKSNLSGGGKQRPEKRLRLQARATVNQQHIGNKQYYINCVWLHFDEFTAHEKLIFGFTNPKCGSS